MTCEHVFKLYFNSISSFCFFFPQADKNIPNSSNVAVEVTPPMNGVAGGDEVRLSSFHKVVLQRQVKLSDTQHYHDGHSLNIENIEEIVK